MSASLPVLTFGSYIDDVCIPWLSTTYSTSTAKAYSFALLHYGQGLRSRSLTSLTQDDVINLLEELRTTRHSSSSFYNVAHPFIIAFRHAYETGYLAHDYMATIKLRDFAPQCQAFGGYSDEQLSAIEECLPYYPYGNYFGISLHSSLWSAQIRGISSCDFSARLALGFVVVSHTVRKNQQSSGRSRVTRLPDGPRVFPLSAKAQAYLRKEYELLLEKQRNSQFHNAEELLFVDALGAPLNEAALLRASNGIREASGVLDFCPRNLRRTYLARHDASEVL